jgi:hypothetical protein
VFTAAQNPNGVFVEYAEFAVAMNAAGYGSITLVAKATAPASATDGDVVLTAAFVLGASAVPAVNEKLPVRVRVPPGKGLYLVQTQSAAPVVCNKTVLYTVQ